MSDSQRWKKVYWGLTLKLLAMLLLLLSPFAILYIELVFETNHELTISWTLIATLLVDFVGRCLHLAAPLRPLRSLIISLFAQAIGIACLLASIGLGENEVLFGWLIMFTTQAIAAMSYTRFLQLIACRCQRNDLQPNLQALTANSVLSFQTGIWAGFSTLAGSLILVPLVLYLYSRIYFLAIPLGIVLWILLWSYLVFMSLTTIYLHFLTMVSYGINLRGIRKQVWLQTLTEPITASIEST